MNVEKISEKIYLIDTLGLGLSKTIASYLIKDETIALIDVGYASSIENLIMGVKSIGVDPSEVKYIILTHIHLDHGGASGKLLRLIEKAMVKAHPRAIKHLIDPSKLIRSVHEVYGSEAEKFGEVLPISMDRVEGVYDGEGLNLGSTTLRFIHTSGHAPHHISIYLDEVNALFSGDALSMRLPWFPHDLPQTPPPSYLHEKALDDLRRLEKLDPDLVLRPHYGAMKTYPSFFDDQASLLELWKRIVAESLEKSRERSLENALKRFSEIIGMDSVKLPSYVKQHLTISFDGMVSYLRRSRSLG